MIEHMAKLVNEWLLDVVSRNCLEEDVKTLCYDLCMYVWPSNALNLKGFG